MKIVGITRIRNEEDIIMNTLNHVSNFVDEIYVYDDCSTDNTVEVCKSHPKVKKILEGKIWGSSPKQRRSAEGDLRHQIYLEALKSNPDYVYYFDSDEYIYPENIKYDKDTYTFRLYDFYITKDDVDLNYLDRKFMGPEFRDIVMMFKPNPRIKFNNRQPVGFNRPIGFGGYVKHYGKAISTEEWESTCDYYINNRGGMFREKWEKRKGKSIHTLSSFGGNLITWDDRKTKGIKLNKEMNKKSIY